VELKIIQDMNYVERFSYSKLSTFKTCPHMYKLNYIDGINGWNNGFANVGSLVHNILERYYRNELASFELSSAFMDEFDDAVPHGVKLRFENGFYKDLSESYKEQCIDYLNSFAGFDGYEAIAIEENFNILIELNGVKIILNGFIDAILKDNCGNIIIVDHKSKSAFKNKDEVAEYARQLYTYSIYVNMKYEVYPTEL